MNRTRLAGAIAGLVLAAAVAVGPVLASSAPGVTASPVPEAAFSVRCASEWLAARAAPSVPTFRAVGDCEIDRRLDTISKLRTVLADAKALTGAHRTALTAILDRSQSGLTGLRSKIDADPDLPTVRADVHAIFADYRIYALVVRQVHLVRGDDGVAAAAARLTEAAGKIQTAIETAQQNGQDVTVASGHLAGMQSAIAAALDQVAGDAGQILPLTPAQWNAGTAKPVLDAARSSLVTARTDLATALTEAKAAVAALK
jgi:hypothetical protein